MDKKNTILYIAIGLMPVLSLYTFLPVINLGYLVLILIFLIVGYKNYKINIHIPTLIIGVFLTSINILAEFVFGFGIRRNINNSISIIFFFTILSFFVENKAMLSERQKFYNILIKIGIVYTAFLLIQFFAYYIFKTPIKGNIPFLTPIEGQFDSIKYGRPTSFFYEPAHYALFIVPLLAISLLYKKNKTAIFFIIGLITSTSSIGFFFAIFIPLFYFSILGKAKTKTIKITFLTIGLVLFFLSANYINAEIMYKFSFESIMNSFRLFGNVDFFRYLGIKEYVFGVGINNLGIYSQQIGATTYNYSNGIFYSLISFGFIGGTLLLVYLFHYFYLNIKKEYKVIGIVVILLFVLDQLLFNRNLLYLMLLLIPLSKKYQEKTYEI